MVKARKSRQIGDQAKPSFSRTELSVRTNEPATVVEKPGRSRRWLAFWQWFLSTAYDRAIAVGAILFKVSWRLPWVAAVLWILFLLITSVTERTTAIEPISVPKSLAERGYTPDVAAQRLRDAMNRYR